jgi:hypothetical protein
MARLIRLGAQEWHSDTWPRARALRRRLLSYVDMPGGMPLPAAAGIQHQARSHGVGALTSFAESQR